MHQQQWISFAGLFVMIGLAWLMSSARRRVDRRLVISALLLQFALAWGILRTNVGQNTFQAIGDFFKRMLDFVDAGSQFVFGENFTDFFFAFKVLPTIIFFSAFMGALYHIGAVQPVVAAFAWLMRRTLRTSGAESLAAAANVFVGQTEAPLVIRPYVEKMTRSELMAVMVGGFSTIAGGVLALYIGMDIPASHLVAASVISAPASLLIAKILVPETETPETTGTVKTAVEREGTNLVEAVAIGATDGLKLALNVAAMLIAFMALLAMCDAGVAWVRATLFKQTWSLSLGFGYLFSPIAFLLGIPASECVRAGELLGLKMVANELVAYERLSGWIAADSDVALSKRTVHLLTYALCGFSNFASIGIQIGGLGGIAPSRRPDLAQLGVRAMLGGTLACLMTACIAGVLLP